MFAGLKSNLGPSHSFTVRGSEDTLTATLDGAGFWAVREVFGERASFDDVFALYSEVGDLDLRKLEAQMRATNGHSFKKFAKFEQPGDWARMNAALLGAKACKAVVDQVPVTVFSGLAFYFSDFSSRPMVLRLMALWEEGQIQRCMPQLTLHRNWLVSRTATMRSWIQVLGNPCVCRTPKKTLEQQSAMPRAFSLHLPAASLPLRLKTVTKQQETHSLVRLLHLAAHNSRKNGEKFSRMLLSNAVRF